MCEISIYFLRVLYIICGETFKNSFSTVKRRQEEGGKKSNSHSVVFPLLPLPTHTLSTGVAASAERPPAHLFRAPAGRHRPTSRAAEAKAEGSLLPAFFFCALARRLRTQKEPSVSAVQRRRGVRYLKGEARGEEEEEEETVKEKKKKSSVSLSPFLSFSLSSSLSLPLSQ